MKNSYKAFQKFLKDNNLEAKAVKAHWPYNYNDNTGYIVTFKGLTQYFFFNDEGLLLARKVIKD